MKNFGIYLIGLLWRFLSLRSQLRLLEEWLSNYTGSRHELELLNLKIEDRLRFLKYKFNPVIERYDHTGKNKLKRWIMDNRAPWTKISPPSFQVPGMLTKEEIQYYHYITEFFSGEGEVVELGPWLGLSTNHLINSLNRNPHFSEKRLHVYDDFVWRSNWMDQHLSVEKEPPSNHEDFIHLFNQSTYSIKEKIHVTKGKFSNYDGNEHLSQVEWVGGPIEMIIVDCGRTIEVNEAWYKIYRKSFIPGKTLIIMQDWRLHRERPPKHFNQTLQFTEMHPELDMIHEICNGGIATFLYNQSSDLGRVV
jgi:hypothetical protein